MYLNNRCLQTQSGMEKKDAEASQPVNLSFPLPDIPAHLGRFAYGRTSTARGAKLSFELTEQILFFLYNRDNSRSSLRLIVTINH